MVSAKAAEQVETRERRTGVPAEENGHPGGVTAVEQAARDHVWIHQTAWVEVARATTSASSTAAKALASTTSRPRVPRRDRRALGRQRRSRPPRNRARRCADQAARLAYASAMTYTTVPAVKLAEKLAELAPGDLSRLFFCLRRLGSGRNAPSRSPSRSRRCAASRKRYKIIARRGSYHGMTYGAMSLTATRNETCFGPFMYGVSHVPHPDRYRSDFGLEGEAGRHHGGPLRRAGDRQPGAGDGRRGHRRTDLDRGRRARAVAEVLADCCARSATGMACC